MGINVDTHHVHLQESNNFSYVLLYVKAIEITKGILTAQSIPISCISIDAEGIFKAGKFEHKVVRKKGSERSKSLLSRGWIGG